MNTRSNKKNVINKNNFLTLISLISDVYIALAADFSVLEFNAAAEKLYGISRYDALGQNYLQLCKKQKKSCPLNKNHIGKIFSTPYKVMQKYSQKLEVAWAVQRLANGFMLIGKLTNVRLEKKLNEDDVSFLAKQVRIITGQEPSKYQTTRDYVQNIRSYYEKILSCMPNNVYWVDRRCRMLGGNDNVIKFSCAKSQKEFVGLDYKTICKMTGWKKELCESFQHDDQQVMNTGISVHDKEEPPVKSKDGSLTYWLSNRVPLSDNNGKIIGIVGISTNITERKIMETELREAKKQLELANQTKSQFITNMEHDIRTPAAGIASLTAILASSETEPEKQEKLNLLANSAQQLLNVLTEILEFHYIDDGQTPVLDKKFNLRKIVQNVVDLEMPSAKMKGLGLRVKVAANVPELLIGDDFRVYRILLNLVGNGMKFTEKGKVYIDISIASQDQHELTTKITITDTGIGIPKEQQDKIFERFSRLHPSNEGRYNGSGLGLRVVKRFITEVGGEIDVESKLGKGTTFTCLIPFKKCLLDRSRERQKKSKTKRRVLFKSGTNVLLIEDNSIARMVGETLLRDEFGCAVDVAHDGNAALRISKGKKYDIIFTDLGLPDIDGKKLASYFRELDRDVPIIALTAHGKRKKDECLASGMTDLLVKPISAVKVTGILTKWLSKKIKSKTAQRKFATPTRPSTKCQLIDYQLALSINRKKEAVDELLIIFQRKLPIVQKDLVAAYNAQDFNKLKVLAHSLKGACSYCGAVRLGQSAAVLEAIRKNSKNKAELYQTLLADIKATQAEIPKYLS